MSGNAHQHVPGCHLRTCCFPFKVTLEDKLPFQLCLKQHQLGVCKTRLCCSIMNLPPNLPALRSELQGKMICQQSSLAMPPHSCHHPLPSIAQCSCMSSCCHPGDGDRDGFPSAPPGKSRCSAPPSPLCRRQRGSSQGCAAPRRAACLWALPQPSWLPRGGTLLTCLPFLLVFYKPWLLHVIRTSTSCPLPCAERDSSTMGHDLERGLWAHLPPSHSANTSAGESRSSPLKQDSPRVQPPPEQPAKRGWWGEGKR